MSDTTMRQVLAGLKNGLQTVEDLLPLTAIGGPLAASVGQIAGTLIDIGQAGVEAAQAGLIVSTSEDEMKVREVLADLQAKNDGLAQRIAAS